MKKIIFGYNVNLVLNIKYISIFLCKKNSSVGLNINIIKINAHNQLGGLKSNNIG